MRHRVCFMPLALASLVLVAAAPEEKEQMVQAFDEVLTAMVAVAAGLCFFAIVWAGFVLMAEGAEGENRGRARNAVLMAVVGLVLVMLAKGIAALLLTGIVPVP